MWEEIGFGLWTIGSFLLRITWIYSISLIMAFSPIEAPALIIVPFGRCMEILAPEPFLGRIRYVEIINFCWFCRWKYSFDGILWNEMKNIADGRILFEESNFNGMKYEKKCVFRQLVGLRTSMDGYGAKMGNCFPLNHLDSRHSLQLISPIPCTLFPIKFDRFLADIRRPMKPRSPNVVYCFCF